MIAWIHGRYTFDAVSTVIANMGRKKGQPAIMYRDKPYGMDSKDQEPVELSEEEKKKYADALFHRLELMQFNYNSKNRGENTKKRSGRKNKTESDEGATE